MLFYTKELVAAGEDPSLIQNPFVLTKIDVKTIRDFNFDLVQGPQFRSKPKKKKKAEVIDANNPTLIETGADGQPIEN